MEGGTGDDTYQYGYGYSDDSVLDTGGLDRIQFSSLKESDDTESRLAPLRRHPPTERSVRAPPFAG